MAIPRERLASTPILSDTERWANEMNSVVLDCEKPPEDLVLRELSNRRIYLDLLLFTNTLGL